MPAVAGRASAVARRAPSDGRPGSVLGERPPSLSLRGVGVEAGDTQILTDLELDIRPGETVAVVGPPGAGKSVLCQVLVGLVRPARGKVRLGGRDLSAIGQVELARTVGYAGAVPVVFGADLGAALDPTRRGLDLTGVLSDVEAAGIVNRLPEGLGTALSRVRLSAGEWQRLGIVRALAHDPDLLVLDDATSNLDTVTEATIVRSIFAAAQGRTVVLVTGRASVAGQADRVVWLDGGRLLGCQPHALWWQHDRYRQLFPDARSESSLRPSAAVVAS